MIDDVILDLRIALSSEEKAKTDDDWKSAATAVIDSARKVAESFVPVYAYRRRGLNYFCTCDKEAYYQLAQKPSLFEVAIFYHEQQ